jgi:hypothetical protein
VRMMPARDHRSGRRFQPAKVRWRGALVAISPGSDEDDRSRHLWRLSRQLPRGFPGPLPCSIYMLHGGAHTNGNSAFARRTFKPNGVRKASERHRRSGSREWGRFNHTLTRRLRQSTQPARDLWWNRRRLAAAVGLVGAAPGGWGLGGAGEVSIWREREPEERRRETRRQEALNSPATGSEGPTCGCGKRGVERLNDKRSRPSEILSCSFLASHRALGFRAAVIQVS